MRYGYGIGFLVLLIGVALWAYLSAENTKTTLKTDKQIKQQVQPWTGTTADKQRAEDGAKFDGEMNNGSLRDLLVTNVVPGGFYEQYFGLKKGDKITQIGGNDVAIYGDEGAAASFVYQAGQGQALTVLRNGQKLTLSPSDGTSGAGRRARHRHALYALRPGSRGFAGRPGLAGQSLPQPAPHRLRRPDLPGSPGIRIPQIPSRSESRPSTDRSVGGEGGGGAAGAFQHDVDGEAALHRIRVGAIHVEIVSLGVVDHRAGRDGRCRRPSRG